MTEQDSGPLYERAYLIAYDPERGRLFNRHRAAFLVRVGVLVDLAYRGAAREVGGRVQVDDTAVLPDPVLAAVASELATRSRSWRGWIRHGYKHTLALVEKHLSDKGVLAGQSPASEPGQSGTVGDPAPLAELRERISSILLGSEPVDRTDRDDATLAVLAVVGDVPLAPKRYRSGHASRYRALVARAGEAFPGIEPALLKLKRTITAARGGMG
jgi:hypothetical protein